MAVAGKVAITLSTENGGAWSADVTYDRLVAVKHNNNLYISRKTVANVEPPNDEFWFLALEGFGGDDVQALIDRLNELGDLIQSIIDGEQQVGNAKTLDGHEAEYFATQEGLDKVQSYNGNTFTPNNKWYRVAERTNIQINNNSCFITLRRDSSQSEVYLIRLETTNNKREFVVVSGKSDSIRLMTKIRYTVDASKTYIEVYCNMYQASSRYGFSVNLFDISNNGGAWKALPYVETEETVSGVTVLTTYDIPANAIPATDLDLANKLDKSGGTVEINSFAGMRVKRNSNVDNYYAAIMFANNNGDLCGIASDGAGKLIRMSKNGSEEGVILHTGNKPSGSYTGNGSATERTINIGGVHGSGNDGLLYVYNQDTGSGALVFSNGAVTFRSDKGIQTLSAEHCYFYNGVLTLKTTDNFLNGSGAKHTYRFL